MPSVPFTPPSHRGLSCSQVIVSALQDTELKPEVLHIVGVREAELEMDFEGLARALPDAAQIILIGPGGGGLTSEQLHGPDVRAGLRISLFPQTYQRYLMQFPRADAPQFVVLFHPGLDTCYFSWYPCLKVWTDAKVPVLVTAHKFPEVTAESPATVQKILETLVGTGGGAGMWLVEPENNYTADDGTFNAGFFVFLGSEGVLPISPDEMYSSLFFALLEIGYPFAPPVGYLDVEAGEDGIKALMRNSPAIMNAIASGAMRGSRSGSDGVDEITATAFAMRVLDLSLGDHAGKAWQHAADRLPTCDLCGDCVGSTDVHDALCPARGRAPLTAGAKVRLAQMPKPELDGREGILSRFDRDKQRWVVDMGGRSSLWMAKNLDLVDA